MSAFANSRSAGAISSALKRLSNVWLRRGGDGGGTEGVAAAQKETEKALAELAAAQTRTDQQVGRLGDNIEFGLEDIARVVAPGYLLRHHGIKMGEFDRGYLNANGHPVEIDLYAEGRRNGKKVIILGEVKSRIH